LCDGDTPNDPDLLVADSEADKEGYIETDLPFIVDYLSNNLMDYDTRKKPKNKTRCQLSDGKVEISWIHLRKNVHPIDIISMSTTIYYYAKKPWDCSSGICVWRVYAYDTSSDSIDTTLDLDGSGNYWVDFPAFPMFSECKGKNDKRKNVAVDYEVFDLTSICDQLAAAGGINAVDLRFTIYDNNSSNNVELLVQEIELEFAASTPLPTTPTSTPTPTATASGNTPEPTKTPVIYPTPTDTPTFTPTFTPTYSSTSCLYPNRVCPKDGLSLPFCQWDFIRDGIYEKTGPDSLCDIDTPNNPDLLIADSDADKAGVIETDLPYIVDYLSNNLMDYDGKRKPRDISMCQPADGNVEISWVHVRKDQNPADITSMTTTIYYYPKKPWNCSAGICIWRVYAYDYSSDTIDTLIDLDGDGNYWVDFSASPVPSACRGKNDKRKNVDVDYEQFDLSSICKLLAADGKKIVDLRFTLFDNNSKTNVEFLLQEIELRYW